MLIALWQGVASSGWINPGLMPTPGQVASKLLELLFGGRLGIDILKSTQRVALGVALGIALAVPVGFLIGWYKGARTFLDPLINFFRALPPIALIPLVVVYFGIDEPAKVVILFYASFFAGVIVMYEGVSQISPIFIKVARTLGASALRCFVLVTLPLVRPGVVAGMLFAFIVSFDNVSLSLFLTNARTNTLPIAILNYVEYNFDPSVAAISTMLVAFSLGAALLVERLVGLRRVVGG